MNQLNKDNPNNYPFDYYNQLPNKSDIEDCALCIKAYKEKIKQLKRKLIVTKEAMKVYKFHLKEEQLKLNQLKSQSQI